MGVKAPKQHSVQVARQFVVLEARGVCDCAVLEELHAVPGACEWLSIRRDLFQFFANRDALWNVGSELWVPLAIRWKNWEEDEWVHRRDL
ncbi:hypothetical protein D3C77_610970 [compost metagenome]